MKLDQIIQHFRNIKVAIELLGIKNEDVNKAIDEGIDSLVLLKDKTIPMYTRQIAEQSHKIIERLELSEAHENGVLVSELFENEVLNQ